jgi:hypothetical protein
MFKLGSTLLCSAQQLTSSLLEESKRRTSIVLIENSRFNSRNKGSTGLARSAEVNSGFENNRTKDNYDAWLAAPVGYTIEALRAGWFE